MEQLSKTLSTISGNRYAPPKTDRCSPSAAIEYAATLMGFFPAADISDPRVFATGLSAVLSDYPEEVVRRVVDPRTGLPGRLKWAPRIAEVREACEAEMEPIRKRWQREREAHERRKLLPENTGPRPTLEELQARCGGPDWGLQRTPKPGAGPQTIAECEAKIEEWKTRSPFDDVPNFAEECAKLMKHMDERAARRKAAE
ncbi:hypothetical protein [Enterovirga sp. CN4-39]|uniref:hypothetical protein n=1 Tax=Enterovirga sp. CN4-39 TaxID=3400910 RepID=UPI003C1179C7